MGRDQGHAPRYAPPRRAVNTPIGIAALLLLALLAVASPAWAAFPTVAATNNGRTETAGTSHTVNLPSGIASGDLLIAYIRSAGGTQASITWPGGWNLLSTGGNNNRNSVAYRVADGSEGATISVTFGTNRKSVHYTWRITGWHGTSPPEIGTWATGAASAGVEADPPSLTASWGSEDNLWLAVAGHQGGTNFSPTAAPTDYTNLVTEAQTTNDGTNDCGIAVSRRALTAATENPGIYDIANEEFVVKDANTIVIRPAAASTACPGRLMMTGIGGCN